MNKILSIVLMFLSMQTLAQVVDDFTDGDFTNNPVWTPDNITNWVISSGKLRSNSITASSSFSITTPSAKATSAQWEFFVNLQFNTSSANFVDIFLTSNLANITSASNSGYFVRIGGTPDEISLYKLSSGTATILINGADGITNFSNNSLRIKVVRDATSKWTLERDATGGTNYFLEGSVTDNTFTSSNFFGIRVQQSTATFFSKHFFDDIYAGNIIVDSNPPTLQSVQNVTANEFLLVFNENLDPTSATVATNFVADHNLGNPSSAVLQPDQKSIKLTFSNSFGNGIENQISVSGVTDVIGNAIVTTSLPFLYFLAEPADFNDIVINELFPDPSPQIGLPVFEFVEIFNASNKPFDLNGWKLSDPSSSGVLPAMIVLSGEYVIVTSSAAASSFTGKVIGLSNFPTLNNGTDAIKLSDPTGLKIDSVNYSLAWYQDDDKAAGGWTLERLNPFVNTNEETNWLASEDLSGGTPGKQNSVFGKNPDSKPPLLLNMSVINQNEIQLQFNEALSALANDLSHYSVTGLDLESVTVSSDALTVVLSYATQFVNGLDYQLLISGVQDIAMNVMFDTQKGFRYFVSSPIKPQDILINEIMADPSPPVLLFDAEYIELYNKTDNPFDLAGFKLGDATTLVALPSTILMPHEYLILSSTTNATSFATLGKSLGVVGFPSINNSGEPIFLKDPNGITIDSVFFSANWYESDPKKDGGWSLERLDPTVNSNEPTNWLASESVNGGTPGKQNSVFGKNPDSKPPQLLTLNVINEKEISLEFNEALSIAATNAVHYLINNVTVSSIIPTSDGKSIHINFLDVLTNGLDYSITITGVQDLAGNEMVTQEKSFRYFISVPVRKKDLIISEIMADPSPTVQLPEAEYLEIYNRSGNAFELKGWQLSDSSKTATFSSHIILPKEYLIITSTTNASKFSPFGKVLGISSFPSLSNQGESVVIRDAAGFTVDSVKFSSAWYGDDEKSDGGWSLEIIDPENICAEETNWMVSEDDRGGTPGEQNSVLADKPDLTGPKLLSAIAGKDKEIILIFNEKLEKNIVTTLFHLEPNMAIIGAAFIDLSLRQLKLELGEPLLPRILYQLNIENLRDCTGNLIQEEHSKKEFALPEAAETTDLLINEILSNPKPNGVDFVEVYNRSEKFINLKNWELVNFDDGEAKNEKVITKQDLIISPSSYVVFTEDPKILKEHYPLGVDANFFKTDLPSLPDDEGSLALMSDKKAVIDSIKYRRDFHSPLIKDPEGVSLERISVNASTNEITNWKSATAFSGYGTPGYINSNARPATDMDGREVSIEPEIISFSGANDFAQIRYSFDESGYVANVKVFDQQGHSVKEIANNETLAFEGFLRWDGNTEDGRKARTGYYLVWFQIFDLDGRVRVYRERMVIYNQGP